MHHKAQEPLLYLITSGRTNATTTRASDEYKYLIRLIDTAVAAKIPLLQIREKNLTDRTLYELSVDAASRTASSATRLLINDRADVAFAAGADGVHLTSRSIKASLIRETFGEEFLIGVSTHALEEVIEARENRADFVVFGPVFVTESKRAFGKPLGIEKLGEVVAKVNQLPVLALGGVSLDNAADCFRSGANGIAAIRLLSDPESLLQTVEKLKEVFVKVRDEE